MPAARLGAGQWLPGRAVHSGDVIKLHAEPGGSAVEGLGDVLALAHERAVA
jgi:hypothetical protein